MFGAQSSAEFDPPPTREARKGCELRKKTHRGLAVKLALLAALVCVGALAATTGGASANAGAQAKGPPPPTDTVTIKQRPSGRPYFDVDTPTIAELGELTVHNDTDPQQIGPHTFSLVKKRFIPKGKDEIKACGHLKHGTICRAIVRWHKITFNPFNVGQPDVDVGNPGWDTLGKVKHQKGDSHFFGAQNEENQRNVTTDKTLYFMCAVHPEMHGKITVVSGP
jgi:hypothetical protein